MFRIDVAANGSQGGLSLAWQLDMKVVKSSP